MRFANRSLTRAVTLTASLGLATVSLTSIAPSATSAVVLTSYGYSNGAWATEVVGGKLPVGSGLTAKVVTGCTRKAGLEQTNHIAGGDIGGMIKVSGVKSHSRTFKDSKGHHSWAENYLAKVDIGDGAAIIKGLTTTSESWVDKAGKYHTKSTIGGTLKVGPLPVIELPDPGTQTIEIPGLVKITIGKSESVVKQGVHAANERVALIVEVLPTDTVVKIGRAQSKILANMSKGVMAGNAYGSDLKLVDGAVTSGKTALRGMPCQGTYGRWIHNNTAGVNLPGVAKVGVTESSALGKRGAITSATTRSKVASVVLGDGQLKITGIYAQAQVIRRNGVTTPKASFGILHVTAPDGKTYELTRGEALTIPGLATLTAGKVSKTGNSIIVTALHIQLLGDTPGASVIRLGNSRAALKSNA